MNEMEEPEPMTPEGLKSLRIELQQKRGVERTKISAEIEVARAHGDLKENAEYHAAKEKQGMVEARIKQLEGLISHAEVIDISKIEKSDRVIFGATITLYYLDTDEENTMRIVGHQEANIEEKKISFRSPIAKAIMGRKEGDEIAIVTPGGKKNVEIMEVEYLAP